MYRVLRELLPEKRRAADRAITSGPLNRALAKNCSCSGMAHNSSVTVFPRRPHWSIPASRPATANCQGSMAGMERRAKCNDRDAGYCGVLAYASEKALRPASARPHHGNEDGTCKRRG